MKKITFLSICLFSIAFTSFLYCNKSEDRVNESNINQQNQETQETDPTVITILPLGDSRVEGATSNSVSYRYDLWKHLVENRWSFDYIGTEYDNSTYPAILGHYFDPDHQGIGGSKTQDILNNINDIIEGSGVPDVVLLGIGGNDLIANISATEALSNISQTINILQNSNSNITIFLERIAPGRSNVMTPEAMVIYNTFNEGISTLANEQSNSTSKIIAVDMTTYWSDDYMADNLHYNALGAKEIADRYYAAIEVYLN